MPTWGTGLLAAVALTATAVRASDPVAHPPAAEHAPSDPAPTHHTTAPNPLAERLGLTPTIEVRGRIDADAVSATQSAASKAQIGDLENGYGFRRARIGVEGTIGTSARWVAEVDFAGAMTRVRDMYVGLTAIPYVSEVHAGYMREPFSLDGATSARFITFMERSPLNQLDPARNLGVAGVWYPENERLWFSVGAFRDGSTSSGFAGGDANNLAVTTRLTGLPVFRDGEGGFALVHLGGAFSQRLPEGRVIQYQPAPQSNLLDVADSPSSPFLPGVAIPARSQQLYNLQAAAVLDSLSFQAEWFGTTIQQPAAGSLFFHGFYADVSYFLTGEHRGYNRKRASFDHVAVRRPLIRTASGEARGFGAVEVAARFSVADFESSNLPVSTPSAVSPTGAVLYQATFGANWYLNDYTRLMLNYTLAVPTAPGAPSLPVHLFGIRTVIWW